MTSPRASLSKTISSPRLGVTRKSEWPSMASTSSLRRPAALTRYSARTGPLAVLISCPPPLGRTPCTAAFSTSAQPPRSASVAKARVVVKGQTMPSPGISIAPSAPTPEVWLARVELLELDRARLLVAVLGRGGPDAGAAPRAAPASRRPSARPTSPSGCRPASRVGAEQLDSPSRPASTRPCPAWRRTRCGGSRCSPCSSRPRRRGRPRAVRSGRRGASARGRPRSPPPPRRPPRRRRGRRAPGLHAASRSPTREDIRAIAGR